MTGVQTCALPIWALAKRCRVVSEETAMPEISQELVHIAEALEDEADTLAGR